MIVCENNNVCQCGNGLANIEVEATVDNTEGTPSVAVNKERNKLTFAFSGLKGQAGAAGADGADGADGEQGVRGYKGEQGDTPSISATAHIGQTIGEPSVEVTVDGTDEAPVFNFTFNGIRGNDGYDGRDGVDGLDGKNGKDGKDGSNGSNAEITQEIIDDIKDRVLGQLDYLDQQIEDKVDELISDAQFWQDKLPEGITGSESNFGQSDVERYLQQIGVWTTDSQGNTVTSWSKIAQDVSSISVEVAQLKAGQSVGGEIDYQALSGALYNYITGNTITSGLQATWAHVLGLPDSTITVLEWMAAGVQASAGGNADSQAAVTSLFAAARDYHDNKSYYDQAWAGVNAIVEPDQNNPGSYVAKGELVTLIQTAANSAVSTAGFATSTDVNDAVALMFAEGGSGRAYIQSCVSSEVSNVTISANQIDLQGSTWVDLVNSGLSADGGYVEINAPQGEIPYIEAQDDVNESTCKVNGDGIYIEQVNDGAVLNSNSLSFAQNSTIHSDGDLTLSSSYGSIDLQTLLSKIAALEQKTANL